MSRTRRAELVAQGSDEGAMRKTVINLHPEVHDRIADIARRLGTSFAEQVRILVEIGLDAEGAS